MDCLGGVIMRKILATLGLAALVLVPTTASAGKSGEITGSITGVSATTWGQPVTFTVDTTPDVHEIALKGRWQVDQLYITYVCGQPANDNLSIHASIGVGGDGQWSTPPLTGNPSLPALDTSQPGTCEAWLIHTNIKGKNHQIDKLAEISFNVSGV
jgi:hypothetical protein